MKIFKRKDFISIEFSDGTTYANSNCPQEMWDYILEHQNNEKALSAYVNRMYGIDTAMSPDDIESSSLLKIRGNTVYMPSVSEISMPKDFVEKILEAEAEGNEEEINKYKNFWTLVSMNPDSRVRDNIFWFIRRWNMKLTESGFIIAYRNADIYQDSKFSQEEIKNIITAYYAEKYIKHNNPKFIPWNKEESLEDIYQGVVGGKYAPIYTDQHSGITRITLGKPVTMPREDTDPCQENTCSRGLHVAATGWLERNYFGTVGLQVLVNPANVVAVPPEDNYGKMRTCEYFPVALVNFDESGHVLESPISLYNDIEYLKHIKYDGEINNEENVTYEILRVKQSIEDMYDSILRRLHGNS